MTEMLLPGAGCRPGEYRVCWPAFRAEWTDYAPEDIEPPRPTPTAADITHHRIVTQAISVGLPDPRQRRVVAARKLTWWPCHPLEGEAVHAWPQIALRVGTDARTAETLWDSGVHRLAAFLDRQHRVAAPRVALTLAGAFRLPGDALREPAARPEPRRRTAEAVDGIRAAHFE